MPDDSAQPYLDTSPPHWVARGLARVIIVLFAVGLLAAFVVNVPETVSGRFILVPITGTDPVRALRAGVVREVRVHDGDTVAVGATLFVIRSPSMSDRSSEFQLLETQLRANEQRVVIARSQYATRRRADDAEGRRLQTRAKYLERLIDSKAKRLALLRELADSSTSGAARGAVGRVEAARLDLEATILAEDVQTARSDLDETKADVARLQQDMDARDLEYEETRRGIEEAIASDSIRIRMLRRDLVNLTDSGLVVTAPCTGTVLQVRVNAPGAVVADGEVLSELACRGERLQAELLLSQAGLPLVRPGQGVKLRLDAFPYQRYGVRFGTIRWLGPAGVTERDSGAFRALVDLKEDAIRVRGQMRPLLPGMGGQADIVVGKRSLVSYAFEPIRALKESFAEPPTP